MFYKRNEYFRYTFDEPLEAEFRVVIAAPEEKESKRGHCQLVNISPGGLKFATKFDIPLEHKPVRLRIEFTLYENSIEVEGSIVWKKPYSDGWMYGFDFVEDTEVEAQIVHELKQSRRTMMGAEKASKRH
ncbi:PilZ domain-containing protein [Sporosarcina sp. FSL K6-1522]|uniref:PilZ domain-containing protein n=1 Tax=Sporosarcina sp. FSL K6-1522 TaxID=2921554 RepID=UPI00315A90EA